MKTFIISFVAFMVIGSITEAKKLKFAVDMTGNDINPNGVHVSGDFQTLAGFAGGDWNSGTTTLSKEGNTQIYSIVVDVPAFRKYEYKFVNGDQFYEAEFVPEISRVGYEFNDNRWLYLDSTSADTFSMGAIRFAANAPEGMYMVRFLVDMTELSASISKPQVAWSSGVGPTSTTALYNFDSKVYEIIAFAPGSGSYLYKYQNGSGSTGFEVVPAACATGAGYRQLSLASDTVLSTVCFSSCSACLTAMQAGVSKTVARLFPNPSKDRNTTIELADRNQEITLYNASGQELARFKTQDERTIQLRASQSGLHFITISSASGHRVETLRWVVN